MSSNGAEKEAPTLEEVWRLFNELRSLVEDLRASSAETQHALLTAFDDKKELHEKLIRLADNVLGKTEAERALRKEIERLAREVDAESRDTILHGLHARLGRIEDDVEKAATAVDTLTKIIAGGKGGLTAPQRLAGGLWRQPRWFLVLVVCAAVVVAGFAAAVAAVYFDDHPAEARRRH